MLFKGLNRDTPERVFVVFEANESGISQNDVVQMDETTDVDGVKARQPDTGSLFAFLGVADAAVALNEFGLAQCYGYRSTSRVLGTDTTIAAGIPLIPVAGQDYFASIDSAATIATNVVVTVSAHPIYAVMLESFATTVGNYDAKIFVRGM